MKKFSQNAWDIIRRPIITEKSYKLLDESSSRKKYVVEVLSTATKASIALAVKNIFELDAYSINIINTKGKRKKYKGIMGKRSDMKKAIITLSPGQTITAFGGE
jgi:large subunit ribosomal protein L23